MRIANSSVASDDGCFTVDTADSSKYETASTKRVKSLNIKREVQLHRQWLAATDPSSKCSTIALRNDTRALRVLQHQCPEPECRRRFKRKYTLAEHMKTHTGEKPHVCPVRTCGKRFSTSGNLSRHKRLHGYIEPLPCPVGGCACTFSNESKLEKHMKFHSGSPVHVCQVGTCGKTFSTTGNLNRHIKHQHSDAIADGALLPALSSALDEVLALESSQFDELAAILHEEIDFGTSARTDGAHEMASLAPLSCRDTHSIGSNSSESADETESPSRKRRRTILDDMIHFHVAHFGS